MSPERAEGESRAKRNRRYEESSAQAIATTAVRSWEVFTFFFFYSSKKRESHIKVKNTKTGIFRVKRRERARGGTIV